MTVVNSVNWKLYVTKGINIIIAQYATAFDFVMWPHIIIYIYYYNIILIETTAWYKTIAEKRF